MQRSYQPNPDTSANKQRIGHKYHDGASSTRAPNTLGSQAKRDLEFAQGMELRTDRRVEQFPLTP